MNLPQFTKLHRLAKGHRLIGSDIERYRAVQDYSIEIDSTTGRSLITFKYKGVDILFLDMPCMNALSICVYLATGLRPLCLGNLPIRARVKYLTEELAEMLIEALEGTLLSNLHSEFIGDSLYKVSYKNETLTLCANSSEYAKQATLRSLRYL